MKWYQKSGAIILLLIFFFPVGAFLMWKYKNWHKIVKISLSSILGLWFLIICIGVFADGGVDDGIETAMPPSVSAAESVSAKEIDLPSSSTPELSSSTASSSLPPTSSSQPSSSSAPESSATPSVSSSESSSQASAPPVSSSQPASSSSTAQAPSSSIAAQESSAPTSQSSGSVNAGGGTGESKVESSAASSKSSSESSIHVASEGTERVVYWGDTGTKIHTNKNCRTLKGNVHSGTEAEAIAAGRTEGYCKVC